MIFSILCLEEPDASIAIVQVYMREYEIPEKLLIKALEHSVRTHLSIVAKDELASFSSGADRSMTMLGTFPDYDMLPLVKEFFLSRWDVRYYGLVSYVSSKGVDSIPFLREMMTNENMSEKTK